jgi:acyl-CoA hydrolase
MTPKTVQHSHVIMSHIILPQDANLIGITHGGVVMKHIDDAAGVAAVKHAGSPVVTASIDRLDFHNPVFIGNLLHLKASVNMVGKTSMEIGVRVEAEDLISGKLTHTASAYLTYVALDEQNKPKPVPPLQIVTEEEKRRHREAVDRRKVRLAEKTKEKTCSQDPDSCQI